MAAAFSLYSKYYDLLYSDKDYREEVSYLDTLIKNNSLQSVRSILNLGCGTGRHDLYLSHKGYQITGVDISPEMLAIAEQLKISNATFQQGDIRTLRLNRNFDAVLSLFHVISYQTTDEDLRKAFFTAATHLKPGGLFIFDCWYGPGILAEQPTKRMKEAENRDMKITRNSTPFVYPAENLVNIKYDIDIYQKRNGEHINFTESHKMRYLFLPELRKLLDDCSFDILAEEEWLTGDMLKDSSWNACIIAKLK